MKIIPVFLHHPVILARGLPGGYQGVGRGFIGGLTLRTPYEPPIIPLYTKKTIHNALFIMHNKK